MSRGEQEPLDNEPPSLYLQVARFASERRAGRAYFRLQETLYLSPDCDVSAYHPLLDRIP